MTHALSGEQFVHRPHRHGALLSVGGRAGAQQDRPAGCRTRRPRAVRWRGMWVLLVSVLLILGCTGQVNDPLSLDDPPADRYVRDYPSNPGYGRADPPSGTFVDVSAGAYSTCGVRTSGALVCWGEEWDSLPQGRFVRADIWDAAFVRNGCAVARDESVECWTEPNERSTLIHAQEFDREQLDKADHDFGQSEPPEGEFTDVSVAGRYACGLRTDASVACWGDNVGDDGYANRPYGYVIGFGYENRGERRYWRDDPTEGYYTFADFLYDRVPSSSSGPWNEYTHYDFWPGGVLEVPDGPFVELHAGIPPCALRPSGELVCWSDIKPYWHLGTSKDEDYWASVPGAYDKPLASVAPGWGFLLHREYRFHAWDRPRVWFCGLRLDGTLPCFGWDDDDRYTQVSYTSGPVCAIRTDRTLKCRAPSDDEEYLAVLEVPAGEFSYVSAGAHHACAIRVNGTVACWGENSNRPFRPVPRPPGD